MLVLYRVFSIDFEKSEQQQQFRQIKKETSAKKRKIYKSNNLNYNFPCV